MKLLKKFIKILLLPLFLSVFSFVKAESIPVENVFSDIDANYEYHHELQTLYDKGMIFPSDDGKFHPNSFLTRAEYVGIASEVSCKRCIQPNTDISLVNKYKIPPFFDVQKSNKYFYCIADAKANNYVAGYDINYKCDDGTYKSGDRPFCLNNTITREEALAVILRMGKILTAQQAEKIRQEIRSGKKYPPLSKDVKPILDDGKVYSFYPDFKKALEYEVIDIDNNGKKRILKLIEKSGDYLYPNKPITKQDFLKMAYVALKANNNCINLVKNNLALEMQVFEKSCKEDTLKTCKLSDLTDPQNIFDFNAKVKGVCEKGIENPSGYTWRFYNTNTGEQIIKKGKFIDNYKFLKPGKWIIYLRVVDNCGNTGEVRNIIYIKENNVDIEMGLKIDANPISGYGPLPVDLKGIVDGGEGPYKYYWDFGDGESGRGRDIKHIFKNPGVYQVKLKVIDSKGREVEAMVTINVEKKDNPLKMGLKIDANPISGYGPLPVDLKGIVDGGEGPYKYYWDFGDGESGRGRDIKHIFKNPGVYQVKLKVIDSKGREVEAYVDINVLKKEYLDVSIDANPIIGTGPLNVDLKGLVNGSNGPFTYDWDFGDGENGKGQGLKHIFKEKGVYEVLLKVTDNDGRTGEATVLIKVTNEVDCEKDSDNDGINDCDDKCPLTPGDMQNSGCPIFDKHCKADCSCEKGYVCGDNNPETCSSNICKPVINISPCLASIKDEYTGITFGNAVCNTCPCTNNRFLDFISKLRYCDFVFPAITSPNERKIYSRGKLFQIQKK